MSVNPSNPIKTTNPSIYESITSINLWIHQSISPSFHPSINFSLHLSISPSIPYFIMNPSFHWWTLKWRIDWWIEELNDWRIDGLMDWKIDELMYWWIDELGLMKWWDCGLMDWWIEVSSTIAFLTFLRGKFHHGVWYERQPRVSECVGQESFFPPPLRGVCS